MRLEIASYKAIRYACLHFHYAKSVPVNCLGYSVFNDKNEWCGVIVYSRGANKNLPTLFGLKQGQVIELVRMALNGRQEMTSRCMAMSLRKLKCDLPLCKLVVSYSDRNYGHFGTIYQACNFYYSGDSQTSQTPFLNNEKIHARTIFSKFGSNNLTELRKRGIVVEYRKDEPKHRYLYPIDKSMIPLCKSLSKPYPKKAVEVHKLNSSQTSEKVGGANPTQSLNLKTEQ